MSRNDKCHEMINVMKCQMSRNDKCHEMTNVIKCQMSWNADAGSMTPSRNTRRYTLRSVPSSPGRSFLLLPEFSYSSLSGASSHQVQTLSWTWPCDRWQQSYIHIILLHSISRGVKKVGWRDGQEDVEASGVAREGVGLQGQQLQHIWRDDRLLQMPFRLSKPGGLTGPTLADHPTQPICIWIFICYI